MSSKWTVKPETGRVELVWQAPDGSTNPFWIDLKKRLTVGEERRITTAGWRGVSNGGRDKDTELTIDWKLQSLVRLTVWIADWSLTDDQAVKLPLTIEQIEALDPSLFEVIDKAITQHVEAVQGKNAQAPAATTTPTASSSNSAAAPQPTS